MNLCPNSTTFYSSGSSCCGHQKAVLSYCEHEWEICYLWECKQKLLQLCTGFNHVRESTLCCQGCIPGEALSVLPLNHPSSSLPAPAPAASQATLPASLPACQRKRKSMVSLSIACQGRQQHVNHSSHAMLDWLGHWSKKNLYKTHYSMTCHHTRWRGGV